MAKKEAGNRRPSKVAPASPQGSEPGEEGDKKRFDIDIFRDWCKSCGICAAFCPRECIALDENGSPVIDRGDRCTGCGWCELHCPDFAISVRPRRAKKPPEED
ncbi:MAG TPA: 4Fe-4S binding protein [Syntrophobacteraceae bacterium]|nr:4Fe-4S binding protein [Syntrophobacteraceae bacterium]